MNIREIEQEITKLERADTTWANIQKLSWLYIVRENAKSTKTATCAATTFPQLDGSFGAEISGKDISEVVEILDEHMMVVKVLMPKEYSTVLEQIKNKKLN